MREPPNRNQPYPHAGVLASRLSRPRRWKGGYFLSFRRPGAAPPFFETGKKSLARFGVEAPRTGSRSSPRTGRPVWPGYGKALERACERRRTNHPRPARETDWEMAGRTRVNPEGHKEPIRLAARGDMLAVSPFS